MANVRTYSRTYPRVYLPITGSGTGAIVFAGTGTAVVTVKPVGSGAIVFAGTGTVALGIQGVGAIVFNGAGTARVTVFPVGVGAIVFGATAAPQVLFNVDGWVGTNHPRWKVFAHQPRWTVFAVAESRFEIGDPSPAVSRWQIGAPTMTNIASASREYVRCPVTANIAGLAYNPTADVVQMAFTSTMREPTAADFHPGSWEVTGQGSFYALCLIGPGGTVQLTAGTWFVWVQIADTPEVPVKAAGTITIYP